MLLYISQYTTLYIQYTALYTQYTKPYTQYTTLYIQYTKQIYTISNTFLASSVDKTDSNFSISSSLIALNKFRS